MKATMQKTMTAAAIDRFGGVDEISVHTLPAPEVAADEVLIRVEAAGVGAWDPYEREGGFDGMFGSKAKFPYVLGTEGAGTVEDVGEDVTRFKEGDRVYAVSLLNPKGGFYAQYAAVNADLVSLIPGGLSVVQAGVMPVDAITGLQGLDDVLGVKPGESVMVFGASGGIGHIAVQLAKRMGARVFAVASGDDGVALAEQVGADAAVDGHKDGVVAAAREFAPGGIDAALVTAGGPATETALEAVRDGGRVAYPNGVDPEPRRRAQLNTLGYDGRPGQEAIYRLNSLIQSGPFYVHVARVFRLEEAAEAHRALNSHFMGKLALRPD